MNFFIFLFSALFIVATGYALPTNFKNGTQHPFIVGGHKAIQGEVPYQLGLFYNQDHYCGATLVEVNDIQIALSAAHCTGNIFTNYTLTAGYLNLNELNGNEQTRQVINIVNHQNHSETALPFDISLLFLNSSFDINENVQAIPLPRQNQVTFNGNVTVSGWGKLEYSGQVSDDLQVVSIPVVNDTACQAAYQNYFYHPDDNMLCAGDSTKGNLYPCQGDSGGPAVSTEGGYLSGIVSWGYECGHPDYPAVFTKVSHYVEWIYSTVENHRKSLQN